MRRVGQRRPGAPKPPSSEDRLDQLERLARLRDAGVLTDEELEREKARVLARA
jgi:hypothetical protein